MVKAILTLVTTITFVYVVCGWLLYQDGKAALERIRVRNENICFRTEPTGGADNSCAGYWKADGKFVDLTER